MEDKIILENKIIRKDKKALQIGSLQLDNPFLLAPLAGITDAPTRRLCREMGDRKSTRLNSSH